VHYTKNPHVSAWDFNADWFDLERSLKAEARFFNKDAERTLKSIFEGIHGHQTKAGRPIVVDAGPGTDFAMFYRARVFQAEEELREAMKRPDAALGPPPRSRTVAGRMNAMGIAVFYGATHSAVALAEVRPPVGSKVLIAGFEVIRPLKLLDLVSIADLADEEGSLFDDVHRRRLQRAQFLRELGERLSKPVLPHDEPLDYLPTQAVADFLASADDPPLDGIIYPSVQDGPSHPIRWIQGDRHRYRCNVVLFHKAARVQSLNEAVDIEVSDNSGVSLPDVPDDGPDVEYAVWVANEKDRQATGEKDDADDAALKFSSLEVHYVRGVKIDTTSSSVPRYARESEPNETR
jgi:hypothetical protein